MSQSWIREHEIELVDALAAFRVHADRVARWGARLADRLGAGGRLLVAGNGGSAAEAQHLTSELVGRFVADRPPFSALCLSAETSTLTALLNDYGAQDVFARQVEAHGRAGDVLILLSTSGTSPNVLRAAERGRHLGLEVWGLTGPGPNALTSRCTDALPVQAPSTAAVQTVHLVAVHAICAAFDERLGLPVSRPRAGAAAEPSGTGASSAPPLAAPVPAQVGG